MLRVLHPPLLCLLFAWPVLTYAQGQPAGTAKTAGDSDTEQLQAVTVSATRTETPVSELTRSVTIIDGAELDKQKQVAKSVGEVLSQTVPGFSQSTEARTDFGQTLRGRNFLTLIDGVPQSTPLRDGRRSLNTIDPNAIERIEVIRGGTAAYGFGATGGLVNIITKRPEDGAFNAHSQAGASISTTHFDDSQSYQAHQRVSGRTGKVDYLLSGSYRLRNGFFDDAGDRIPADPVGVQGGLADTEQFNALGKIGYQISEDGQRLALTVNHFDSFQDSRFAGLGMGDASEREKTPAVVGNINAAEPGTKNTLVNLEYQHPDILGSALKTQLYYGDLTTRFSKFPGFPQVQIVSEKLGARATFDTPVNLGGTNLDVTWGADYLTDETDQEGLDAPSTTPKLDQDAVAGFVEVALPLGSWGRLRSGVRHENIEVDADSVLNAQGIFVQGGTLEFDETLFNLTGVAYLGDNAEAYGGFSQGFSLADIGRAISDGMANRAEALESEAQKVDNYELGVRGFGRGWDASLTTFFSESDNGTTFNQALEIAKTPEEIYGVEAAGNIQATGFLNLGGTATWQEGEVDLDDDGAFDEELPSTRIPPVKVTAFVEYTPSANWSARLQGLYSGHREPDSTQFGNAEVEDYVVFDLQSRIDVGPGWLGLGIDNLFNQGYFPVLNQAQGLDFAFSRAPGRTVSAVYALNW